MLKKFCFSLLFLFFFTSPTNAAIKKIIYIPIDNRPVCLKYPMEAVQAYDPKLVIVTPPEKIIASRKNQGNPDELWKWLVKNAADADAAVIAADALIYGGLVQSRIHTLSEEEIVQRVYRLKKLKDTNPKMKIYCFTSLLRSPRQSFGDVEPPYYEKYGPWFFRIGELTDLQELHGPNILDITEMNNYKELIPEKYYDDWFSRRDKNLKAHMEMIKLSEDKFFHYYAIGKDDNAPFSQTHMEARKLSEASSNLSVARFQIVPGIDQIGILLLMRALNESTWAQPYVYTVYSSGRGPLTIPLYSDQPVNESISIQIITAGAIPSSDPQKADLILAVNTPEDGINKESIAPENAPFASFANKQFIEEIKTLSKKKSVALADIAYANGSDNGFMKEMAKQKALYSLAAYSGWNTADNSLGYAIALGLMSKKQSAKAVRYFLQTRFIDDWFYQSNVRVLLTKDFKEKRFDIYRLDNQEVYATKFLNTALKQFNEKNDFLITEKFTASFPWNRLFEINIDRKR